MNMDKHEYSGMSSSLNNLRALGEEDVDRNYYEIFHKYDQMKKPIQSGKIIGGILMALMTSLFVGGWILTGVMGNIGSIITMICASICFTPIM